MQVLELHFNPKAQKGVIFDTYCYEAENIYEKRLGNLYMAGQLSNIGIQNTQLLDNLASVIKGKYYTLSARSPGQSLRESLKAANKFLADLVKKGNVDWLGNLDFAILALKQSQSKKRTFFTFNFTKVGKIKILLMRGGTMLEIGKDLEAQDLEPYPLKIFFNTASGRLQEDDRIIAVTSELFKEKQDLIQKMAALKTFDEKELKELLKTGDAPSLLGFCFLANLVREASDPIALTLQEKPERFVWLNPVKCCEAAISSLAKLFNRVNSAKYRLAAISLLAKLFDGVKKIGELPRTLLRRIPLPRILFFRQFQKLLRRPKLAKIKLPKMKMPKKVTLIPVLCFFLLVGFLIFKGERAKSLKIAQEILARAESKIVQAQSFLILEEKAKANLLFQEAWQEILPQANIGAPLEKKASQIKTSIEEELSLINKLEEIKSPKVLPDFDFEKVRLPSPYLFVFSFSQNSFAIYVLDANSGQIIKYPYTLFSGLAPTPKFLVWGRGEPQFWLKPKNEQIEKAPDISRAKSIAVDGSIWILFQDNSIGRYHAGFYQETLKLNLFPVLKKPTKIWTSPEHQELYLLEPKQNRIVILSKDGQIIKQYQSEAFNNLLDFAVSEDSKTIWLLNGLKVFTLTQP